MSIRPGDSWNAAYQAAAPGDVLVIEPGQHPAVTITVAPNKPAGSEPVLFKGGPGVVVTGDFTSGASGAATGAKSWELRDVKVNGPNGIVLRPGNEDVILRRCDAARFHIESKGGRGTLSFTGDIQVLGGDYGPSVEKTTTINGYGVEDVILDGVYFHDYSVTDPATHNECMQIWPTQGRRITVRNCVFYACTDFGVLVKAPESSEFVFEDNWMDMPMPGNENTTACGAACPRAGNSLRFSSYPYPNSKVTDNMLLGGLSLSDQSIQNTGNQINKYAGGIPVPPIPPPYPDPDGPPPPPPDTTAPVLVLPAAIVTRADTAEGIVVAFTVTATDEEDASVDVVSTPASGSLFPVGVTTVVSTATDDAGNVATGAFTVTVEPMEPPVTCGPPVLGEGPQTDQTSTVTWTPVPGATAYRLYKNGILVATAGPNATSAKFGKLSYGETRIGVAAVCPDGEKLTEARTVEARVLET